MMKDNILLAQGGKNKVFIFDAYGKLFKIIDVSSHFLTLLLLVLLLREYNYLSAIVLI